MDRPRNTCDTCDTSDKSYVGLDHCFVCGKATDVLINPRLRPVFPAHGLCTGGVCDECREIMKTAVFIIEVHDSASNTPNRTGQVWGLKEAAIEKVFLPTEAKALFKQRICYLSRSAARAVGLFPAAEAPVDPSLTP